MRRNDMKEEGDEAHKLLGERGCRFVPSKRWHASVSSTLWSYSEDPSDYDSGKPSYAWLSHYTSPGLPDPTVALQGNERFHIEVDCEDPQALLLDLDLVGVQAAQDVLRTYEQDVDFHRLTANSSSKTKYHRPWTVSPFSPVQTITRSSTWDQSAEMLTADFQEVRCRNTLPQDDQSVDTSMGVELGLDAPWDALSSCASTPCTPQDAEFIPSHMSDSTTDRGSTQSSVHCLSTSEARRSRLNASASSFVPGFLSCNVAKEDIPPFHSFIFPSLNSPSPSPTNIQKDDQGFYAKVQSKIAGQFSSKDNDTPPFLPPFLHEPTSSSNRRNKLRSKSSPSKTRAIIDQLRSSGPSPRSNIGGADTTGWMGGRTDASRSASLSSFSPAPSPSSVFNFSGTTNPFNEGFVQKWTSVSEDGDRRSYACNVNSPSPTNSSSASPSIEEDEDGWIRAANELAEGNEDESETRRLRARDLFLTLARRAGINKGEPESISSVEMQSPTVPSFLHADKGEDGVEGNAPVEVSQFEDDNGWVKLSISSQAQKQSELSLVSPRQPNFHNRLQDEPSYPVPSTQLQPIILSTLASAPIAFSQASYLYPAALPPSSPIPLTYQAYLLNLQMLQMQRWRWNSNANANATCVV